MIICDQHAASRRKSAMSALQICDLPALCVCVSKTIPPSNLRSCGKQRLKQHLQNLNPPKGKQVNQEQSLSKKPDVFSSWDCWIPGASQSLHLLEATRQGKLLPSADLFDAEPRPGFWKTSWTKIKCSAKQARARVSAPPCVQLATPQEKTLQTAYDEMLCLHPLLRCLPADPR